MRPLPAAAGFHFCRPGSVSRARNEVSSADARRDRLSAMPLAVAPLTNARREVHMLLPFGQKKVERIVTSFSGARTAAAALNKDAICFCEDIRLRAFFKLRAMSSRLLFSKPCKRNE